MAGQRAGGQREQSNSSSWGLPIFTHTLPLLPPAAVLSEEARESGSSSSGQDRWWEGGSPGCLIFTHTPLPLFWPLFGAAAVVVAAAAGCVKMRYLQLPPPSYPLCPLPLSPASSAWSSVKMGSPGRHHCSVLCLPTHLSATWLSLQQPMAVWSCPAASWQR